MMLPPLSMAPTAMSRPSEALSFTVEVKFAPPRLVPSWNVMLLPLCCCVMLTAPPAVDRALLYTTVL